MCQDDIRLRDYSLRNCLLLVRDFIARLPRYRTYLADRAIAPDDASVVGRTFAAVREARPDLPPALIDFTTHAMLGDCAGSRAGQFVARLQQLSTAVAAKAEEDTAFYRYVRFIALNDGIGARPDIFAESPAQFHQQIAEWQQRQPAGLRTTSTHDSKRREASGARLGAWTGRHGRRSQKVALGQPANRFAAG